jgi:Helix-turn-helix domain/Integrase core domain
VWIADITYIPTWGFLYLAVVLDTLSRRIVGWAMATHLRTELVLAALNMAIGQRRPAAVIHHADQGSQGEFKRPPQHLDRRSSDGYAKAPFRSMWASTVAVTGAASGSTAGELSAVLGSDCSRRFNRGRCYRRRNIARRRWPVVPEGRRHDTFPCCAVFRALLGRYLSFAEREEIAILGVQDHGVRAIARKVGRAPSTISRELGRNAATRGGGLEYRATTAQWHADRSLRRPKPAKLVENEVLRRYVEERFAGAVAAPDGVKITGPKVVWKGRRAGPRQHRRWAMAWSPEQIARRLPPRLSR